MFLGSIIVRIREVVMAIGTVKWFDKKKGYGFVVNDIGDDVFVHYSQINGNGFRYLKDGEKVEYDQVVGQKGLQGTRVRVISDEIDSESDSLPADLMD